MIPDTGRWRTSSVLLIIDKYIELNPTIYRLAFQRGQLRGLPEAREMLVDALILEVC